MEMEVNGRLSKIIIFLHIALIYICLIFENASVLLSYSHLGHGYFAISILFCLSLMYLCGRYNSKIPVVYFLFCCLWGVVNYVMNFGAFYTGSGFGMHNLFDMLFVLPSSSLAGTIVALTYDYDIEQMIQLSLVIQPIAIVISYIVGRYIRKRKQAEVSK